MLNTSKLNLRAGKGAHRVVLRRAIHALGIDAKLKMMKILRLFLFCVLAIVLPVNTVLAKLPALVKIESDHLTHVHASHQYDEVVASVTKTDSKPQLHLHLGLFGKLSVHVHEPIPAITVDCIKACQVMPNSMLFDPQFAFPFPLTAVLVGVSQASLSSVILAPPEDPPRLRA